jgi:geranylgeranyl diphosphate synthase, type I
MTAAPENAWIRKPPAYTRAPTQSGTAELYCVRRLMQWLARAHGSLGDSAAYHLSTGGKCLRARLALAGCAALNVPRKQSIYLAAACEFLHNASLVHDDIQDKDVQRRDQETVWYRYGINTGITLGDFFLVLGFLTISKINCSAQRKAALHRVFGERVADVVRGQGRDLDSSGQPRLTISEYDRLARAKTGPLLSIPVEGALLLSGANETVCEDARTAMGWLGLAYQLRDDLLDFCVQNGRDGAASDLRNGKANAVLLDYLTESTPQEQAALADFLARSHSSARNEEVHEWVTRIRESIAFEATVRRFRASCANGRAAADRLPAALADILNEFIATISAKIEQLGC